MMMAETGIRQSAKTMYAGMTSTLATTMSHIDPVDVDATPPRQSSAAGSIERPQMIV